MKKHGRLLNILTSCCLIILTLCTATSATFAWFATRRNVEVLSNGFQVVLPEEQKAELYYHTSNYNKNLEKYAGFEKATLTEENYSSFEKIEENKTYDPSPTNSEFLWPNHQLTFALVFTPLHKGKYSFSLTSYVSKESKDKKTKDGKGISLAFAIDVFSACYKVKVMDSANIFNDAKKYFTDSSLKDQFQVTEQKQDIITPLTFSTDDNTTQCVLYFTLLFSNDSSTFYEKGDDDYYKLNPYSIEQSNCYEGLSFNATSFTLKYLENDQ